MRSFVPCINYKVFSYSVEFSGHKKKSSQGECIFEHTFCFRSLKHMELIPSNQSHYLVLLSSDLSHVLVTLLSDLSPLTIGADAALQLAYYAFSWQFLVCSYFCLSGFESSGHRVPIPRLSYHDSRTRNFSVFSSKCSSLVGSRISSTYSIRKLFLQFFNPCINAM